LLGLFSQYCKKYCAKYCIKYCAKYCAKYYTTGKKYSAHTSDTAGKSLMPLGHMNDLKPSAPARSSAARADWLAAFSGTMPAQKPMFTLDFSCGAEKV
jgi:hypothetical protein